jgi:hypothetical protein
VLARWPGVTTVADAVCLALQRLLAQSPEGGPTAIVAAGGVPALCACIEASSGALERASAFCALLTTVVSAGGELVARAAAAARVGPRAMAALSASHGLLRDVSVLLLAVLTAAPDLKAQIAAVAQALVASTAANIDNDDARQTAQRLLAALEPSPAERAEAAQKKAAADAAAAAAAAAVPASATPPSALPASELDASAEAAKKPKAKKQRAAAAAPSTSEPAPAAYPDPPACGCVVQ